MKVKLQNFANEWVEFDIGQGTTVLCAMLQEISGDEVLEIVRRNKAIETYDSDKYCRHTDYNDGSRVVCVDGEWEDWFLKERVVNESEVNHE